MESSSGIYTTSVSKRCSLPDVSAVYKAGDGTKTDSIHQISMSTIADSTTNAGLNLPDKCYQGSESDRFDNKSFAFSQKTKQSRQQEQSGKIPNLLLYLLKTISGVKESTTDRAFIGNILLAVTIFLSVSSTIVHVWHRVCHFLVPKDKYTIFYHIASSLWAIMSGGIGIYANTLVRRLLKQRFILQSIRTGVKTILKINVLFVILLLGLLLIGTITYKRFTWDMSYPNYCTNETACLISEAMCPVTFYLRTLYTFVGFGWNLLLAYIVLSVSRTHTIGLRKFIKTLQNDGNLCVALLKPQQPPDSYVSNLMTDWNDVSVPVIDGNGQPNSYTEYHLNMSSSLNLDAASTLKLQRPMTCEEIIVSYWKIEGHLRGTSEAFERWMLYCLLYGLVWTIYSFLYWHISHLDVLNFTRFVLPPIMIVLLFSSYSEVNGEAAKVPRCIFLYTQDRVIAQDLYRQLPLQVTVFGIPISARTIGSVAAALVFAFMSKIFFAQSD